MGRIELVILPCLFFLQPFRSVGCILYTLLVGKPPFETQSLKDTYARIKKNEYHVPSRVGPLAKKLIVKLLQVIWLLLTSPLYEKRQVFYAKLDLGLKIRTKSVFRTFLVVKYSERPRTERLVCQTG